MQHEALDQIEIVIERYSDGYVGYPLGLKGVVIGAGDTFEEAVADTRSATRFHLDTFGTHVLESSWPTMDMVLDCDS